mgnify:CR=1 FL=1
MEISAVVLNAIKGTGVPMKSSEIAVKAKVDKKEVDKAIKKLVAVGKLYSPKKCYYDLKK